MSKFTCIAIVVSVLHFAEDAILVALGRYTELNYFVILIGTIIFGVILAAIARISRVKRLLGK